MDERKALNKNSVCVWLCHRCSVPTQQSAVFALKPEEPVYYCIIGFKLIMANRRSCAFLWCGSVHLTALSMSEECRYLPRAINNLLPRVQRCPRTICIITWNHIVLRGWLKLPPLHDCVVCRGVVVLNMEVSRGNIPMCGLRCSLRGYLPPPMCTNNCCAVVRRLDCRSAASLRAVSFSS